MTSIVWIDRQCTDGTPTIGGKGAGLAFLAGQGIAIPPAFVVTAAAYRRAVGPEVCKEIESRLTSLEDGAPGELEEVAAGIRRLIIEVTEAHPLRQELSAACDRLAQVTDEQQLAVAVRSSSITEDAGDASFAGEHDTYLWVIGPDEIDARVRDCWASLFTARALAYRGRAGRSDERGTPAMAVVVQQMIPAQAAGVFMTLNPTNGDRSKLVIESIWGLGEPLVSGEANPDRFLVDKVTGEIIRREVSDKRTEAVRDPVHGRGVVLRPVDDGRRQQASLTDTEIAELVRIGRLVECSAGGPQDGEFAVLEGRAPSNVRLLQCRPETVWSRRPRETVTGRRSALDAVMATLTSAGGTPRAVRSER